MSFVNLYDVDEFGNFVLIGSVKVNLRKECPNCYVMFVKIENHHCLHRKKMDMSVNIISVRVVGAESKSTKSSRDFE